MPDHLRLLPRRRLAAALATAMLFLTGCAAPAFGPQLKGCIIEDIGRVLARDAFASGVDFGDWSRLAAENRALLDAAETPEAFAAALSDTLMGFGVSHLSVLSPKTAAHRREGTAASMGVTAQPIDGPGLLLTDVVVDGPAHRCGMRRADVLLTIDGQALTAAVQLSGQLGHRRHAQWRTQGSVRDGIVEYTPHRRASPDTLEWVSAHVGLISVHSFSDALYDRVHLEKLFREVRSARGVILDLRSNKGGNADNVRHLLGLVLPGEALLFSDVYRKQADVYARTHLVTAPDAAAVARSLNRQYKPIAGPGVIPISLPMVVLVDGQCGSGGELAPAILQEQHRAVLIGAQTRGKVRIGENKQLQGGYELQTPIGELVTAGGQMLEGSGARPDILLSPQETAADGVIIRCALDALKQNEVMPPESAIRPVARAADNLRRVVLIKTPQ